MDGIDFKNRVSGCKALGLVAVKVSPRNSSCECRNCGHTDKLNRDRERFICTTCGHIEHADIGAAKTITDRVLSIVRGDSPEQEPRGSKRLKNCKEISARTMECKRVEPRNLGNQDMLAEKSSESPSMTAGECQRPLNPYGL